MLNKLFMLFAAMAMSISAAATDTSTVFVIGTTTSDNSFWSNTDRLTSINSNHYSATDNGFTYSNTQTTDEFNMQMQGYSETAGMFGSVSADINGLTITNGWRNTRTNSSYENDSEGLRVTLMTQLDFANVPGSGTETTYTRSTETTEYGSFGHGEDNYSTYARYTRVD